jgi:hypothetical protein
MLHTANKTVGGLYYRKIPTRELTNKVNSSIIVEHLKLIKIGVANQLKLFNALRFNENEQWSRPIDLSRQTNRSYPRPTRSPIENR